MDWYNFIAVLIAGISFLYTYLKGNSDEIDDIVSRLAHLEGVVDNSKKDIDRLEQQQSDLDDAIDKMRVDIHKLDLKVERILAILEK
ncbi:hypothetical protein NS29R_09570 [Enterobacter hormaechei subsp. xiangfangensis]|uniref:hypothetical protein n=1 Tax=Enterobacter hormaechei TaxID=158836 RepID=UPI000736EFE2|nr:hypothetical protein [Enterobacter hormaechei]KTQ51154.1 hypothetical protein NS23R_21455 [Enterobacter hormaechei]KTQ60503.1 hypothetical protein NS28R_11385 [Enterobacter hormaechei subsp. xiangfangensis]KTQ66701.1 hypothetical protein NS34R_02205 [Enterobacter hormaechei]KTQ67713.1 hypothetical protein NS19R_18005 [Enterobacter hormaechei subsp. xiangfangensis]KTQ81734.1 hypothetical protein NS7_06030 [Enterobacter hormaechei]